MVEYISIQYMYVNDIKYYVIRIVFILVSVDRINIVVNAFGCLAAVVTLRVHELPEPLHWHVSPAQPCFALRCLLGL